MNKQTNRLTLRTIKLVASIEINHRQITSQLMAITGSDLAAAAVKLIEPDQPRLTTCRMISIRILMRTRKGGRGEQSVAAFFWLVRRTRGKQSVDQKNRFITSLTRHSPGEGDRRSNERPEKRPKQKVLKMLRKFFLGTAVWCWPAESQCSSDSPFLA